MSRRRTREWGTEDDRATAVPDENAAGWYTFAAVLTGGMLGVCRGSVLVAVTATLGLLAAGALAAVVLVRSESSGRRGR